MDGDSGTRLCRTLCLAMLLIGLCGCAPARGEPVAGEMYAVDGEDEAPGLFGAEGMTTMATTRDSTGAVRAPEFPDDAEWLNAGRSLRLADLRGKLVLLDFWTYGCINCMHVIPDLKRLEDDYPDELVVIGVHSAKFGNEGELSNLRQVLLRYGIEHPVVDDSDFRIWQQYAVRAWPTTVLVDPRGRVVGVHSGEGVYVAFKTQIDELVAHYDERGQLSRRSLDLVPEAESQPETALSYPGKVLVDGRRGWLFIADTNHHRLVMTDLHGQVMATIGSGQPGLRTGDYSQAQFFSPQGMALDGDLLYVADTGNHAIRVVDLASKRVDTVVGDGSLSYELPEGSLSGVRLNSPWDLELVDRTLYIAMAGRHQLWALDLDAERIAVWAGTGREALLDGRRSVAAFAQPSGLAADASRLYVADSEASAVRAVDLVEAGRVRTIVGEGLFAFGDVDGTWPAARLEHPLGVAVADGRLFVADTYNHRIKVLDVEQSRSTAFVGDGQAGWEDGPVARFYEPGGLDAFEGTLYVADTNNHVIRLVDLASRDTSTLPLSDPRGLLAPREAHSRIRRITFEEQVVRPGAGELRIRVELPEGYKLNDLAPSHVEWTEVPDEMRLAGDIRRIDLSSQRIFPLEVEANYMVGEMVLVGEVALYYCQSDAGVCLIHQAEIVAPITVSSDVAETDLVVDLVAELEL